MLDRGFAINQCKTSSSNKQLKILYLHRHVLLICQEFLFVKDSSAGGGGIRFGSFRRFSGSLKRNLLIPRRLIFESSVRAGMPSFAAAPAGPETRPPVTCQFAGPIPANTPTTAA